MKILSWKDLEDLATQVNRAFQERDVRITELEQRIENLIQEQNNKKPAPKAKTS